MIIGTITPHIETLLNLLSPDDRNIYIGDTNILHMQTSHPADYAKYKDEIPNILSAPDYVGLNPKNQSIEYVKEFAMDGEYVKVAVRISKGNRFYARSVYVLNSRRVKNFIQNGTLIKT